MDALMNTHSGLNICVIGAGGCGGNTLTTLAQHISDKHVKLWAVNTDAAALKHCEAENKLLIGETLTKGYGAGADPDIGLAAARENEEDLRSLISGADIVIVTAGLGGGTGTGVAPFILALAQEQGIHCMAVMTLPFSSEGKFRNQIAYEGLEKLTQHANAYITLSNDQLLTCLNTSVGIQSAFTYSNAVLRNLLGALVQMLTCTGIINVDLNDLAKILSYRGESILGVGTAMSQEASLDALEQALNNPLVYQADICQARGIILQIFCREDLPISCYDQLTQNLSARLGRENPLIIQGLTIEPALENDIEILVIASGIGVLENEQEMSATIEDELFEIPAFVRALKLGQRQH